MREDNGHEDVGELRRQLEETKRAQGGSDRRVQELTEENKRQAEELAMYKSGEAPEMKQVTERESLLSRQTAIMKKALDDGLDPKLAVKLLANPDLDDDDRLQLLADVIKDTQLAERQALAKSYGRKVHMTEAPMPGYNELLRMSNDQIAALGPAVNNIIDQELASKKQTIRSRLWELV